MLVLGNGQSVIATKENEFSDLWRAVPGSFGSIAVITSVRIKVVPATPTVELQVIKFQNEEELVSEFASRLNLIKKEESQGQNPSWIGWNTIVEGLAFKPQDSPTPSIIGIFGGCLPSSARVPPIRPWHKFWYQSMELLAYSQSHRQGQSQCFQYRMPTIEYLFRHDRGGFWSLRVLSQILHHELPFLSTFIPSIENWAILRFIFSVIIPNSSVYAMAMNFIGVEHMGRSSVMQDVDIPPSSVPQLFSVMQHEWGGAWPLWICPVRQDARIGKLFSADDTWPVISGKSAESAGSGFCVNVGIYAVPEDYNGYKRAWRAKNRNIEAFVAGVGGRKGLYAQCFWENSEEFWNSNYDRNAYDQVRKERYAEGTFVNIYDKISSR